ncbi:inositol monophosphatase family protein [Ilumatobacter sp.]|uniref:inositol monophosphatase family protein n=1 Tax=Ilumatobacter sp. TaxID=1967498 RepID=UPI003B525565
MTASDGTGAPGAPRIDAAEVAQLRGICEQVAHAAGSHAAAARRRLGPGTRASHDTKSSDVDPVTEFDRETEELVVRRIRELRPHDSIVGEEGADHRGTSGDEWHVDPIDGTVNFVYDLPGWCTSIAVLRDGVVVAGAIYAPAVDEVTSAGIGLGTTVDGVAVRVSAASELATSLAATGFAYELDRRRRQGERLGGVMGQVRDVRREGSAALDLAHVAAGRVDTYFEEGLNSWDAAAGVLAVTEAGGVVTTFAGTSLDVRRPHGLVAAGPTLHPAVLEMLGGSAIPAR